MIFDIIQWLFGVEYLWITLVLIFTLWSLQKMWRTHTLSLPNYILSFHFTHTHTHSLSLSSLNSNIANFFSLFLFLIPVYTEPDLVHRPEKNEHQIRQFMHQIWCQFVMEWPLTSFPSIIYPISHITLNTLISNTL